MVLELRVTGQRFYKPDPGVVILGVKKNHVGSSCGEKHAVAVLVVKALWWPGEDLLFVYF